jgi:hypothetical protein
MWFLDYLFDTDWDQREDIDNLAAHARRLRVDRARDKKAAEARLTALEGEIGEIALFCRTVVEVLIDKGVVDRKTFLERMRPIDASDGREDGKLARDKRAFPPESR